MDYQTLLGVLAGVFSAAAAIRIMLPEKRDDEQQELVYDSSRILMGLELKIEEIDKRDKEIAELKAATEEIWDKVPGWSSADTARAQDILCECNILNDQDTNVLILGSQIKLFADATASRDEEDRYDPMKLPSSVCSDAEWDEISYGPGSTHTLTQQAIEDMDLILHGDQVAALRWAYEILEEAKKDATKIHVDYLTAKHLADEAEEKAAAEARHATEYNALMSWMKEGSIRNDESLSTYEQRKLLGRRPRESR